MKNKAEEYLKRYFDSEEDYLIFLLSHDCERSIDERTHKVLIYKGGQLLTSEIPSKIIHYVDGGAIAVIWTENGVEVDNQYFDSDDSPLD